jgi:hypothetical protein
MVGTGKLSHPVSIRNRGTLSLTHRSSSTRLNMGCFLTMIVYPSTISPDFIPLGIWI